MRHNITSAALVAVAILLSAGSTQANVHKPGLAEESMSASQSGATTKGGKAKQDNSAAKVKIVDINSAGKGDLMTLPGVSAALAEKIIAGRPYGSKAFLVTRNIITPGVYEQIKHRIIARQK